MKKTTPYYLINGITWYRLLVTPILLLLIFAEQIDLFRWMLAFSFMTDAIDGFLARKFKVVSVFGARLDSIADDFTMLAGIIAIIALKPFFILQEQGWMLTLLLLYIIQLVFAIIKYGKPTSFHTYLAKAAAVCQGIFLLLLFFLEDAPRYLFYFAVLVTIADLIEEILLIALLKKYRTDVKGLYRINEYRADNKQPHDDTSHTKKHFA